MIPRAKSLLRRLDFEQAAWQMYWLVVEPRRVSRTVSYHFQTTGRWARDDPAFLLLLSWLISFASVSFGLAFFSDTLVVMARVIAWTIFVDLVATGVVTASVFWWISNRYLRDRGAAERVEWRFCFDVHLNSWFVLYLYVYLGVYVFLPGLIVPHSWVSTLAANAIYAAAVSHYTYISFVGYSSLPFLRSTNLVFVPVGVFLAALIVLTVLFKWNVVIFVMNLRYA